MSMRGRWHILHPGQFVTRIRSATIRGVNARALRIAPSAWHRVSGTSSNRGVIRQPRHVRHVVSVAVLLLVGSACGTGPGPAVLTRAEAISAAQLALVRDLPEFRRSAVTDARQDRYANARGDYRFDFRTEPEPAADQPVWLITLAAPGVKRDVTVVVDATDGHIVFWSRRTP
jgi:hypothetical protein